MRDSGINYGVFHSFWPLIFSYRNLVPESSQAPKGHPSGVCEENSPCGGKGKVAWVQIPSTDTLRITLESDSSVAMMFVDWVILVNKHYM